MRGALALALAWLFLTLPATGQTLRLGIPLEPPNLDPTAGAAAAIDEVVLSNLFEGLTRIEEDRRVVPLLAQRWTVSADGRRYVFTLREGVRFHDGRALDAAAVVFSLDRARAPGSANAAQPRLAVITAVTALDARTVEVRLARPMADLPRVLAWGDLVIVHTASAALAATAPVGTGPFRFGGWRRGYAITLDRFDGYWGRRAGVERAVFRLVPDPATASAALRAGDIDAFPNYPAAEDLPRLAADPRFAVVVGETEGETILALNNRRAPFNDVRVRRALAMAIDARAIVAAAMGGYGRPIGSHFPPGDADTLDLSRRWPHDPARARTLLAEAGYPNGFDTTLKLPPVGYARRGGEIIQAQLALVGVRVSIENVEWAPWLDGVLGRNDFDMTIVSHTEPLDYDIYARPEYYFGYDSPTYRADFAQLEATTVPGERRALLHALQRRLADDQPNVFLFQLPKLGVWRRDVTGLWRDAPLQAIDLTRVSLGPSTTGFAGGPPPRSGEDLGRGPLPWLAGALALGLAWLARGLPAAALARRAGVLAATLIAASGIVFVALSVVPGDPAAFMLGLNPDPAALTKLRAELGIGGSPWARYAVWAGGLFTGDLGQSVTYKVPVAGLVADGLALSLPLALASLLLAVAIAIPAALLATARPRLAPPVALAAGLGVAMPNFWLGLLLILGFAVGLRWLPAGGFPGWDDPAAATRALILPTLALALPQAAILTRVARAALAETMGADYLRTARAKGASPARALIRHALPNAMVPVLTLVGLIFSFLLAGAIIVENVFALPGLGRLVFQAIGARDLVVVQGVVMLLVAAIVVVAFAVDLAVARLDPRARA